MQSSIILVFLISAVETILAVYLVRFGRRIGRPWPFGIGAAMVLLRIAIHVSYHLQAVPETLKGTAPLAPEVLELIAGSMLLTGFLLAEPIIRNALQSTELLRSSEAKHRNLFIHAGDAIFLMHGNQFVDCNPATARMFGYERDEILQLRPWEVSPEYQPDGRLSEEAARERIVAALSGTPQRFEWRHQRKDGTPFDAEVTLNRVEIDGKPMLQAIVRDITTRKETERALAESEQRYRSLVDQAPDIILTIGWPDECIRDCNYTTVEMTGYTREELIGRPVSELYDEESRQDSAAGHRTFVELGELRNVQRRLVCKDGRRLDVSMSAIALRDAEGRIIAAHAILRDVTEQARARHAERERDQLYRLLASRATDIIARLSLNGELEYISPSVSTILGYEPEELLGHPDPALIYPQDRRTVRRALVKLARYHEDQQVTFRAQHREGHYVWLEGNCRALTEDDSGRTGAIHAIVRDITERQRHTAQHEALSRISHLLLTEREAETIYRVVPLIIAEHLEFPMVLLELFDHDSNEMVLVGAAGLDRDLALPIRVPMDQTLSGEVALWGEPLFFSGPEVARHYRHPHLPALPGAAMVCVPLRASGWTVGTLTVLSPIPLEFDEGVANTLQLIASHIALNIENRQSHRLLAEATHTWQDTFDLIADAITVYSLDFNVLHVNRAAQQLIHDLGTFPARKGCYFSGHSANCGSRQCPCHLVSEGREHGVEEIFVDPLKRHFEIHAYPRYDSDGNLIGFVHVSRDITHKVRQNEQMRKLTAAVDQSGNMILITDRDGRIEYVNRRFTEVTGYTAEETIGDRPSILKSGKQDDRFYREVWDTITSGKTWSGTLRNRRKNGEIYWERQTISPILDSTGRISNFLAVKEDITAELQAQEQLMQADKLAAVGMLAAGVAHEFKNYLGGIIGNASFALEELQSGSDGIELARETLQQIVEIADRANGVAMSLLTYSRARTDDVTPENLAELIRNTIKLVEKEIVSRGIELATYFEDVPPVPVSAGKIQQVILNLLINAQQAVGKDGVITVALVGDDEYVHVKIGDSGGGIPDDVLPHIFDPFFSTKGVWGEDAEVGTGMGLTICRNIAREHGGDLTVQTLPGVGSTFTLTLPLADTRSEGPHPVPSPQRLVRLLLFTLDRTLVHRYFGPSCRRQVDLVCIDDISNLDDPLTDVAELVIIDARFVGKLELLRLSDMCEAASVPYVVIRAQDREYYLESLYDRAAAVYSSVPECQELMAHLPRDTKTGAAT